MMNLFHMEPHNVLFIRWRSSIVKIFSCSTRSFASWATFGRLGEIWLKSGTYILNKPTWSTFWVFQTSSSFDSEATCYILFTKSNGPQNAGENFLNSPSSNPHRFGATSRIFYHPLQIHKKNLMLALSWAFFIANYVDLLILFIFVIMSLMLSNIVLRVKCIRASPPTKNWTKNLELPHPSAKWMTWTTLHPVFDFSHAKLSYFAKRLVALNSSVGRIRQTTQFKRREKTGTLGLPLRTYSLACSLTYPAAYSSKSRWT